MRWKTSTAVRASLAFLFLLRVARFISGWVGWVGRRVHLLFRLFFLGLRRGISRTFFLGQLFPGFRRRLGNPCLQFLGINLFGSRTKEASLVDGRRVLQVAPNDFKLLKLASQGIGLGLQGLGLGLEDLASKLQRLVLLAQSPVFLRQLVLGAHRHNLWRAWPLSGYTYTAFLGTWIWRSRSPRLRPWVSPTSNQLLAA